MKLIQYIFNGGLPLSQNVLDWTQAGLKDAIHSLAHLGYNGVPVALAGCEYDPATNDVTAGWIYDGTELHYFPGGNTTTAGTNLVKVIESTTTVVFESGAIQPIYSTKQYSLDNTGTLNITTIRRFGITASSSVSVNITEALGQLDFKVNTAARILHISGEVDTLTAASLAQDGLAVTLVDDTTLEADPVFGPHYPSAPRFFHAKVMPFPVGSGVYNDVNNIPFDTVPVIINNNGIHVNLRKTAIGNYPMFFDCIIFID